MTSLKDKVLRILILHGKMRVYQIREFDANLTDEAVSNAIQYLWKHRLVGRDCIMQTGAFKRYVYSANKKGKAWLNREKKSIEF